MTTEKVSGSRPRLTFIKVSLVLHDQVNLVVGLAELRNQAIAGGRSLAALQQVLSLREVTESSTLALCDLHLSE